LSRLIDSVPKHCLAGFVLPGKAGIMQSVTYPNNRRAFMTKHILSVFFIVMLSQAVFAQDEGDPERGRIIAYTCFGCHGVPHQKNVYPTYSVPKLGGQTEGYLVSSLQAYQRGDRKHPTMHAQANTLSDRDIRDIASYFVTVHKGDES